MVRNEYEMKAKARRHTVEQVDRCLFTVTSGESDEEYTVGVLSDGTRLLCNCEWGRNHPATKCSHTIAVEDYLRAYGRMLVNLLSLVLGV